MRGSSAARVLLALALASTALLAHADGTGGGSAEPEPLPLPPPERPFLLLDAPRRYRPTEPARVRVQLRDGGEVRLALYRVTARDEVLALAGARQGTSIASRPLGAEAERLLAGSGPMPRRGTRLSLLSDRRVSLPKPSVANRVWDETEVYDSNEPEEDEVATYWVRAGGWSVRQLSVGRLGAGLYLVRAHAGPWATTAILSVGELVIQARRGDTRDTVLVTDANGAPQRGVAVSAHADDRRAARVTTGANGEARLPPSDAPTVRFLVERGADLAWADVAHARLDPCDPLVYLGTGRPLYRTGETIHVRGHVRGCDAAGHQAGLAGEVVEIRSGEGDGVEARTDGDGNFVARVPANGSGDLRALVRGKHHERTVRIDSRVLPRRALSVHVSRPFATPGDLVAVRVADEDGGWPDLRDVVLETPAGRLVAQVGPRSPAVFHVRVPEVEAPIERFPITASVSGGQWTTTARAELWVGRTSTLIEIGSARTHAAAGEEIDVSLRATSLAGTPSGGNVELALYGSDGNRARGAPRWRGQVRIGRGGEASQRLPLAGAGPWLLRARRGEASSDLVVWERARPPQLSQRGDLAVVPSADRVAPGSRVEVAVRVPAIGRAWVTLEQGSVWTSRLLPTGGASPVRLTVPEGARGMARLVISHVAEGRVTTRSATVEVSSEDVSLAVTTDRRFYAEGERARVSLRATKESGGPSDGVVSLWLADAGYWEMGEDEYPMPGPALANPGRMASGGDSTRPLGYAAEEGRVLPGARMLWNGRREPRMTYRHAWGYYGAVTRVAARGTLRDVARALARAAGLSGARVCRASAAQRAALEVVDLPWDMVALRIAERTDTTARLSGDVLELTCGHDDVGLAGFGGSGMGSGGGGAGYGMGGIGHTREERLEGTLRFVGLRRLGPDGSLELDLDLPDHPGRWRVEALLITDEGGGGRGHQVVHTRRALEVRTELPPRLRPGDYGLGEIHVRAPSMAGREVTLDLRLPAHLALSRPLPGTAALDAAGELRLPVHLAARSAGAGTAVISVRAGSASDAVEVPLEVLAPVDERRVSVAAFVGPGPTDVHVPLPEPTAPTLLEVSADPRLDRSIERALAEVEAPRWHIPAMRIDRLASLTALREAAGGLPEGSVRRELSARLEHAHRGEAEALFAMIPPGGGIAWWGGLPESGRLTAEALLALGSLAAEPRWASAWDSLRRRVRDGHLDPEAGAVAALLLAGAEDSDRRAARALVAATLRRRAVATLDELVSAALAARALRDPAAARALGEQLETGLVEAMDRTTPQHSCAGPAWFLCYGRLGSRGAIARAARALFELHRPRARALGARALAATATAGAYDPFVWGSAEADVLSLAARVERADGRVRFEAIVDGRRVPVAAGRVAIPAGARSLLLRFHASVTRFAQVSVSGTVHTRPPRATVGNAALTRQFRQRDGAWELAVAFRAGRQTDEVEIAVPLPAGLDLAPSERGPRGARLRVVDGEVRLHLPHVAAGARSYRLRLVRIAPGDFDAAPARLAAGDDALWGLVPGARVTVR